MNVDTVNLIRRVESQKMNVITLLRKVADPFLCVNALAVCKITYSQFDPPVDSSDLLALNMQNHPIWLMRLPRVDFSLVLKGSGHARFSEAVPIASMTFPY
jgi:hypothetical protein